MPVSLKVALLFVPLIIFAGLGAIYVPSQDSSGRWTSSQQDISLDALPGIPSWAEARLPKFGDISNTAQKKSEFFSYLYPRIVLANSRILIERQYLETLARKDDLSEPEANWLAQQAERLRVDEEPGSDAMFAKLKSRLDVIPPSLVMAQAANESAWGTSRFAREGNNLFGQWCFSSGCGIVPARRPEGKSYEVAVFASPYHSIKAYLQNLNRHATYQTMRDIRREARKQARFASGAALATGLTGYSERGDAYVSEIQGMIRHNDLSRYDQDFRSAVLENGTVDVARLAASKDESALLPGQSGSDSDNEG